MSEIIPDQRRRQILQRLTDEGAVRVSDLAAALDVAEETIRRDLRILEQDGLAVRTHGGAMSTRTTGAGESGSFRTDVAFGIRLKAMSAEKQAIAAEAVKLVQPESVIALDGSTTAWELARLLPRQPLTIVTNSWTIINLLAERRDVQIICTGGQLNVALQMFDGILAHDALGRMNIDLAFFSCRGIDAQRGFSDPSEASAAYKQRLIELSQRSIVMADHTKFEARSVVNFAPPGKVDEIITDGGLPATQLRAFQRLGVKCTRAAVA